MNVHETRKHRLHREWLLTTAIAMLLLLLFIFLRIAQPIGNVVYDHFLRSLGFEHSENIVIVSVDDRSLKELGNWPFKRSNYQRFTEQLQDPRFRPKALGIDLLFFEPTEFDQALADSIRQLPAVLPIEFKIQDDAKQTYKPTPPIAPLGQSAQLAHINLNFDSDGTIRSFKAKDRDWQHFALAMHALGDPSAKVGDLQGVYRFQMVDPRVGFPTVSLVDVLHSDFLKSLLKDKYVLLGVTSPSLGDRHPTLYSGETNNSTPGVAILASILNASLKNALIESVPPVVLFGTGALGVFGLLRSFVFIRPRVSLLLAILFIAAMASFSYVLLSTAKIWFDPTPSILVTALVLPLWTWRRLEAIVAVVEEKTADLQTLRPQRQAHSAGESKSHEVVLRYGRMLDLAVSSVRSELDFLSTVIDELPDAIVIFDNNDALLLSNRQVKDLFDPELLSPGASLAQVADNLRLPVRVLNNIELLDEHDKKPITFSLQTQQGPLDFYVKSTLVASPLGGSMRMVILTNVTELTRSTTQRDRALQFLSHDMRTPVAAILSVVQQENLPHLVSDKIRHHGHALLQMMDDFILNISAEAPEYTFKEELLDNLLNDAIERVFDLAKAKHIDIADESGSHDVFIMANTRLLVRALVNLLFNAVKFSPDHGRITISTSHPVNTQSVTIRISNFVHISDSSGDLIPSMPGFGLGLHFADTVIHKHNGQLLRRIPETDGVAEIEISLPCTTH